MNAQLGADTDALRAVGSAFARRADLLGDLESRIMAAIDGAEWFGPDAEAFRADWSGRVRPALQDGSLDIRHHARRLLQHADEQDHASAPDLSVGLVGGVSAALGGAGRGGAGGGAGSDGGAGSGLATGEGGLPAPLAELGRLADRVLGALAGDRTTAFQQLLGGLLDSPAGREGLITGLLGGLLGHLPGGVLGDVLGGLTGADAGEVLAGLSLGHALGALLGGALLADGAVGPEGGDAAGAPEAGTGPGTEGAGAADDDADPAGENADPAGDAASSGAAGSGSEGAGAAGDPGSAGPRAGGADASGANASGADASGAGEGTSGGGGATGSEASGGGGPSGAPAGDGGSEADGTGSDGSEADGTADDGRAIGLQQVVAGPEDAAGAMDGGGRIGADTDSPEEGASFLDRLLGLLDVLVTPGAVTGARLGAGMTSEGIGSAALEDSALS